MMIDNELRELVVKDFETRGRTWPSIEHAFMWISTEIAEAIEVWMGQFKWVRNNPDRKPTYSKEEFERDLGDVIYMIMVIAAQLDLHPIEAMKKKNAAKLEEYNARARSMSPTTVSMPAMSDYNIISNPQSLISLVYGNKNQILPPEVEKKE
jgi:NTP pyrophosphatase (non-canonical NTP hydrolase)